MIEQDSKFLAENNLMDYSVLFIQFANRELDTEADMPAVQVTHTAEGGFVFQLLRETVERRTTYSKSAVTVDKEQESEEAKAARMKALQKTFQKRLRPGSAGSLGEVLKRAIIKKFLNERINKKFGNELLESEDKQKRYRVGVIDFLTSYGTAKYFETQIKGKLSRGDSSEISCQEPGFYQERFVKYMSQYF